MEAVETYNEERVAAGNGGDAKGAARLLPGEDTQSSAAASERHGCEFGGHCGGGEWVDDCETRCDLDFKS